MTYGSHRMIGNLNGELNVDTRVDKGIAEMRGNSVEKDMSEYVPQLAWDASVKHMHLDVWLCK